MYDTVTLCQQLIAKGSVTVDVEVDFQLRELIKVENFIDILLILLLMHVLNFVSVDEINQANTWRETFHEAYEGYILRSLCRRRRRGADHSCPG